MSCCFAHLSLVLRDFFTLVACLLFFTFFANVSFELALLSATCTLHISCAQFLCSSSCAICRCQLFLFFTFISLFFVFVGANVCTLVSSNFSCILPLICFMTFPILIAWILVFIAIVIKLCENVVEVCNSMVRMCGFVYIAVHTYIYIKD